MSISKKLSLGCLNFVKNNTTSSEEDLEKIYYGIQIFWINIFKFILLFITAYLLGVLRYTFTAFIVFAILRTFASGVHANSTLQCIIINYILFLGNVYLSLNITLNLEIRTIIYFISFALLLLYSPADTEERPLISKKLRKILKIKSILVIITFYIITLFIVSNEYVNLITFSILEETIVITPMAYKLLGKKYANYRNVSI
ncbi:Accessory gene regulator protein B [Clostridium sp. DL-VIII]|uniref:accessory gene regulator B family protein n=1 Tax=Clostridium sp. DL-VIII TaxID=641107 RepID=UPI00023AFB27|nr:accessory gene regulator B family protein [Clostridium sp. DL-VIII]EHI99452.1 Accessory gene regulator protein B [Clostridium sp. DL-VIII]